MVWEFWYVFKYIKSNYPVLWCIFIFLLIYCRISAIPTTTQYIIIIRRVSRGWYNISTFNRCFFITCCLLLVITFCIYFINLIIHLSLILWPDLLSCDIFYSDLKFDICLNVRVFNTNFTIHIDIHISQPRITLWLLIIFHLIRHIYS